MDPGVVRHICRGNARIFSFNFALHGGWTRTALDWEQVHSDVNKIRGQAHLPLLAWNRQLATEAERHAGNSSPGHRRNLLDPKFTETGIGAAWRHDGTLLIVQEFISK